MQPIRRSRTSRGTPGGPPGPPPTPPGTVPRAGAGGRSYRGKEKRPRGIPATGLVWLAIVDQIDKVDSHSKFVSAVDFPCRAVRSTFTRGEYRRRRSGRPEKPH